MILAEERTTEAQRFHIIDARPEITTGFDQELFYWSVIVIYPTCRSTRRIIWNSVAAIVYIFSLFVTLFHESVVPLHPCKALWMCFQNVVEDYLVSLVSSPLKFIFLTFNLNLKSVFPPINKGLVISVRNEILFQFLA